VRAGGQESRGGDATALMISKVLQTRSARYLIRSTFVRFSRLSLMPLVHSHLPAKMASLGFHRVDNMPHQYKLAAIASSLASKIVYAEGVNFVKSQPAENLSMIAMRWIEVEKEMDDLADTIDGSGMDEEVRERLKDLVKRGGVRTSLNIF